MTQELVTIDAPSDMRRWSADTGGRSVALVATMGALHGGHRALIDTARAAADLVVVSIFVNPMQFGEASDFDGYPRPLDADLDVCASAGADAVYAPTAATMYPAGFDTRVVPGALASVMEGASRPGHFEGVTTVIAKLFTAVRPDVAVFGQKDYQQLAIIRRLVTDLDLGVTIIGHPTVREADGLAMSSRNRRLTQPGRIAAGCMPRALAAACSTATHIDDEGVADVDEAIRRARAVIDAEPLAMLDYLTVFDASTLQAVEHLDPHRRAPDQYRIGVAAWFGEVRLIDNADLFGNSTDLLRSVGVL